VDLGSAGALPIPDDNWQSPGPRQALITAPAASATLNGGETANSLAHVCVITILFPSTHPLGRATPPARLIFFPTLRGGLREPKAGTLSSAGCKKSGARGMPDKVGAEHWRVRAANARDLAEQMSDRESKRHMLRIAADYERLARRAQTRAAQSLALKISATGRNAQTS
jgi:hypothetical protein